MKVNIKITDAVVDLTIYDSKAQSMLTEFLIRLNGTFRIKILSANTILGGAYAVFTSDDQKCIDILRKSVIKTYFENINPVITDN